MPTARRASRIASNSGNTAPRGAASTIAGEKVWVVDANRKVYVYNTGGGLLGSWTAGTLASNATVEGIATNGTDIWIVDAKSDKVFKYTGAATRTSGTQNAASSFSLNSSNTSPKDIVTDGTSLWVVNDSTTDKVFKYSVSGSLKGKLDDQFRRRESDRDHARSRRMSAISGSSTAPPIASISTTLPPAGPPARRRRPRTSPSPPATPTRKASPIRPAAGGMVPTEPLALRPSVSPASALRAADESLAGLSDSPLKKASWALGWQDDSLCLDTGRFRESRALDGKTAGLGLSASPTANRSAENDTRHSQIVERQNHGQAAVDDLFAEWETDALEPMGSPAVWS